jgi:hypothetical protein
MPSPCFVHMDVTANYIERASKTTEKSQMKHLVQIKNTELSVFFPILEKNNKCNGRLLLGEWVPSF